MRTAVVVLLVVGQHAVTGRDANAARKPVNITVPFRLSLQKVERGIKEQLFTGPEGTCTIAEDKPGCRRVSLSAPLGGSMCSGTGGASPNSRRSTR